MMTPKTVHYLDINKIELIKMQPKRTRTLHKMVKLIQLHNLLRQFKLKWLLKEMILLKSMTTLRNNLQLTMDSMD